MSLLFLLLLCRFFWKINANYQVAFHRKKSIGGMDSRCHLIGFGLPKRNGRIANGRPSIVSHLTMESQGHRVEKQPASLKLEFANGESKLESVSRGIQSSNSSWKLELKWKIEKRRDVWLLVRPSLSSSLRRPLELKAVCSCCWEVSQTLALGW